MNTLKQYLNDWYTSKELERLIEEVLHRRRSDVLNESNEDSSFRADERRKYELVLKNLASASNCSSDASFWFEPFDVPPSRFHNNLDDGKSLNKSVDVIDLTEETPESICTKNITKVYRREKEPDSFEVIVEPQIQKWEQELCKNGKSGCNIENYVEALSINDTNESIIPIDEEPQPLVLTVQQEDIVKSAFAGDPNQVLAQKFNLNIKRRDILTLARFNWLNDNVINFYMNLIMERGTGTKWPKCYAMNTFFYPKLTTSGPESLKRWTKKVDLFTYDLICVPIHLGLHWCMAIINLKEKTIKYYDSMGKPNDICLNALRNYLEFEHQDKKGQPFSTKDFQLDNVDDIPQQMNGSDCGMFLCTFAEFVSRKAKFSFSQNEMPYLRRKMAVEIITGRLLIK